MTGSERIYRLLIVDDDEFDRRHYSRLLAHHAPGACVIVFAADGAAGLILLRAQKFDCVLLDFNLPDMNGLQFLTSATADSESPCAFVLVTGQGNEVIAVKAMKLGVQDYLVKSSLADGKLWDTMVGAVNQRELRLRLDASRRDLRVANAGLEQEIAAHEATEVELRVAKEAAEEASRAKTRFVAMITHELRTPLNGILGYAQLLRLEGGLSDQQGARVTAMTKAGQHLQEMIERVLDFASIETGRLDLRPELISVHELTERCMGFIGPMATERGLGLHIINSHDAPKEISADPARLRQVLLNLLGNAVKFTSNGSIELRVLPAGTKGNLRLEVADTGPGINEADRKSLFQDFKRLDAGMSVEGTGLGLAISSRIIGLMGGTLGHKPDTSGGSVFWLELPPGNLAIWSMPKDAPIARSPMPEQIRALLVDDIAMNRDVIGAFLGAGGHQVQLAENGQDAVRLASEQIFDVILMDVRMPEMDGLEATRLIRALPGPFGQVPILALTAYSFSEQVTQCRAAGMDGHVSKPVEYTTMLIAIADVIARSAIRYTGDSPTPVPRQSKPLEPTPLRLDRTVLDQVLAVSAPEQVEKYFQELHRRKQGLFWLLSNTAKPAALTDALHEMTASAGIFGFMALSAAAHQLERAMASKVPESEHLVQQMREELQAALGLLHELMIQSRKQPTSSESVSVIVSPEVV
jgi:signal transduction histidine kinase/HPt (histidine-containing phosphotransfer) domain-containing protein